MRKWLIIAVLVLLAVAGVWFGRPAYRSYKERKFAAQTEEAWRQRDGRKAGLTARQVLVLNPSNLVACSVMAELAEEIRSPQAVMWRQRVADIQPTPSNLVILAASALRYEPPPFTTATQALERVKGQGRDYTPFHVVSAQLALKQNRQGDAERHFEEAIRLEPTNALHRLNLATVRLQSRDAAASSAASSAAHIQLSQLATNPTVGEFALRSLTQFHAGKREYGRALEYSAALLRHPRATFEDRLGHLSTLHAAKSPGLNSFIGELKAAAGTNALQVFALGGRLVAVGESVTALEWLKSLPTTVQNEQPVPLAIADAYAALKGWPALEQYLASQSWKEQDFVRLALLAYAVRNQKDDSVANVHWSKAVTAAGDRPPALATLAQMSANWRWTNENRSLLWRVARDLSQERWAVEALHSTLARERDTRGLHSLYTLLLERTPTNVVVQNNYAALSLLLTTNLAAAHQLAERVYQSDRNNVGFISTYAWSLHLRGRTSDALREMGRIPASQLAEPTLGSYYGVMLAASGQRDKARQYLTNAAASRILPEERTMVEQALK